MAPIKEWFGTNNVIYRWFLEKYGEEGLELYWKYIAGTCFEETVAQFRKEGLSGIDDYFRFIFNRDGGAVKSTLAEDCLLFEVLQCPDYTFMDGSDNPNFKPIRDYCGHHRVINKILAEKAGFDFKMAECDGAGHCKWIFNKPAALEREE
jgi:hypothetical protein